jgi:probable rRNA maturation factor
MKQQRKKPKTAQNKAVSLQLTVQYAEPRARALLPRSTLRGWVRRALAQDAAFTLRFVGAKEGRALNSMHRGKDYATNVLTFEYGKDEAGILGADIVICMPIVLAEAKAQKKHARDHAAHMVIHGVLHAQGFDHLHDKDATRMEAHEVNLLAGLRLANPYL